MCRCVTLFASLLDKLVGLCFTQLPSSTSGAAVYRRDREEGNEEVPDNERMRL